MVALCMDRRPEKRCRMLSCIAPAFGTHRRYGAHEAKRGSLASTACASGDSEHTAWAPDVSFVGVCTTCCVALSMLDQVRCDCGIRSASVMPYTLRLVHTSASSPFRLGHARMILQVCVGFVPGVSIVVVVVVLLRPMPSVVAAFARQHTSGGRRVLRRHVKQRQRRGRRRVRL